MRVVFWWPVLVVVFGLVGCNLNRSITQVAMSDGVKLRTEITTPDGYPDGGPYPVILVRSPYGIETQRAEADKWRAKGYVFVMQEIRGTGQSKDSKLGALFEKDAWGAQQDGKETMDWLLAQPWCNTQVGTLGFSGPAIGETMLSGASQEVLAQVLERTPASLYGTGAFVGGVPKGELDYGFWNPGGVWEQHPAYDAFWATQDTVARAPEITAPAIHVGGWYDLFLQGAIDGFTARQENGGPGAAGHQKLIVGPWTHDNEQSVGVASFPDSLLEESPLGLSRDQLKAEYMNFWLKGEGAEPDFTVLYYTMGSLEPGAPGNEWHFAETWPPLPFSAPPIFLAPGNVLDMEVPAASSALSYTYNPANPVPSRGGQLLYGGGAFDQTANAGRSDVLSFFSAVLDAPVEITGPVGVRLYVSSDAADTDFTAELLDIYPDGKQYNVVDGIRRLSFREDYVTPLANAAGTVYVLDIDLWNTSYIFNTGHKIGVHVSSSNNPRFVPNPLPAHNEVHVGGDTPSAVFLPVVN